MSRGRLQLISSEELMTQKQIEARYKKILKWRSKKHPMSFSEIGLALGVSKARAHQLHGQALRWLRSTVAASG